MSDPRILPDPDGMNDERAAWALHAVKAFQEATGTDNEDAICDLLADLMHLAAQMPKQFGDFDIGLERAREHFSCETTEEV